MQPAADRVKFTYEDLLAFPDDGKRHELIDGDHYVTPSPSSAHQLIVGNFYFLIRGYLANQAVGVVMLAPFDIVLSNFDVVEPDLVYFAAGRFGEVVGERNAQGPPDLAVEVLSPSTRRKDEIIKRKLYERTGVGEYWIVDPELETVKVYRLAEGKYRRVRELAVESGDVLASPLFPGLELSLSQIFKLA